jgi:hypothetical protein
MGAIISPAFFDNERRPSREWAGFLYDISPFDVATFISVSLLLGGVALPACDPSAIRAGCTPLSAAAF